MRRLAPVLVLLVLGASSKASAQSAFLSRSNLSFEWTSLVSEDRRYDWQGVIGFDVDVVTSARWLGRFSGDYVAVLGRERRRYDLNQGTYTFDISGGYRVRPDTEIVGRLTHTSRHVVDRDNPPSISWNTVGARVRHRLRLGRGELRAELGADWVTQPAFVDYAWTSDLAVSWRQVSSRRATWYASGWGGVRVTDEAISTRPRICGGRIEAGLSIRGEAAGLDIFAGYERRMDAYPTDRFRVRMFLIGVRIR